MRFLRRLLPDPASARSHPALRRFGAAASHPKLWSKTRRGVALGAAIGVFFGLLLPVAQIPFSIAFAAFLRAHVPFAIAGTFITNPLTSPPIYVAAYYFGGWLLGSPAPEAAFDPIALSSWLSSLSEIGAPLAAGLSSFAVAASATLYFSIRFAWRLRVERAWRGRRLSRSR